MRRLRILALMHEDLVPPDSLEGRSEKEINAWKTEYDVCITLEELGHKVTKLGVHASLVPIRETVRSLRPHVVFNLLDEFQGEAVYDHHVVAYLELLGARYTGCSPRGLVLSRDKALSKKIVAYHRIRAPRFAVFRRGRRVRKPAALRYPLIVKSLVEEASLGIARASVVEDAEQLEARVHLVHERVQTDAIAEEFIIGREVYVGVLGNERLQALPPQELVIRNRDPGEPLIATARVKHDPDYQERHGIDIREADDLDPATRALLVRNAKRIYRLLELRGYGRVDFRIDAEGRPWFLEANPNPEIAEYEEFASAAECAGIDYESLLQKIVSLGMRR